MKSMGDFGQGAMALGMLTDLYQLTMAHGYWARGLAERRATFHVAFRRLPFAGGYALAGGVEPALEALRALRFSSEDIAYLAGLTGGDGRALLGEAFLEKLKGFRFVCDVEALPEGSLVFPHEPILRVTGPLWQAQLVESLLLNVVNFQTLIATKARRVVEAAQGDPVLDFGLRRAQGIDGALAASRAAYLGGGHATSNVLAGRLYEIPVSGTHAHSWVMVHEDEVSAFEAYAEALPNNAVFLVDTFDTLEGVDRAVAVGKKLRAEGHRLQGVRLDSGDLAALSIQARARLDAAGFHDTVIYASNDLDERIIESLKFQGAAIGAWGVGTKLVTAYDQPALGGVYKLSAIEGEDGWQYKVKLSEQLAKVSVPGRLQVRRFYDAAGMIVGDVIYDEGLGCPESPTLIDPMDSTLRQRLEGRWEDLLRPALVKGEWAGPRPSLHESRAYAQQEMERLNAAHKRLLNPHLFPVGLEASLWELRHQLVLSARQGGR